MLNAAADDQLNLIVRPYGHDVWFIQLDDLKADQLARLAPRILLILETSPGKHAEGNYQAWLALEGSHDKEFARRVRRGAGTDKRATGATRIAGSVNFKEKYAPDFPRVTIHTAQPGRKVTAAAFEELGLVAPPEEFAPFTPRIKSGASSAPSFGSPARWPSYRQALDNAPLNSEGTGPDRSNADLRFAMTAISWGFGVKDTAARLMEESAKAKQKGRGYAEMIADTAARFVAQRRQQQPRQRVTGHRQG
jgi:hypothetical protein